MRFSEVFRVSSINIKLHVTQKMYVTLQCWFWRYKRERETNVMSKQIHLNWRIFWMLTDNMYHIWIKYLFLNMKYCTGDKFPHCCRRQILFLLSLLLLHIISSLEQEWCNSRWLCLPQLLSLYPRVTNIPTTRISPLRNIKQLSKPSVFNLKYTEQLHNNWHHTGQHSRDSPNNSSIMS